MHEPGNSVMYSCRHIGTSSNEFDGSNPFGSAFVPTFAREYMSLSEAQPKEYIIAPNFASIFRNRIVISIFFFNLELKYIFVRPS